MKDDLMYLGHIRDAIAKIEKYREGYNFEDFSAQSMPMDAAIRELMIIGEAAKRVSADFRAEHSEIPWKRMTGMRDRLTHDYIGVDERVVWETCKEDLPLLKAAIEKIV